MKIKKSKGFSLIELLITVAIVGILAGIAYPSYTEFVAQSNRSEAQRELLRLANLMEQYYLDHRAYTTDLKKLGNTDTTLTTDSGNYKIVATGNAETYTLTATAQTHQATIDDSTCLTLSVDQAGARLPSTASSDCWEQ